jgi:hypothetical protein
MATYLLIAAAAAAAAAAASCRASQIRRSSCKQQKALRSSQPVLPTASSLKMHQLACRLAWLLA